MAISFTRSGVPGLPPPPVSAQNWIFPPETVGDVLVHVHLGLQEMLLGVVSLTDADPDTDAAIYWRSTVSNNDSRFANPRDHSRWHAVMVNASHLPLEFVAHHCRSSNGAGIGVVVEQADPLRGLHFEQGGHREGWDISMT